MSGFDFVRQMRNSHKNLITNVRLKFVYAECATSEARITKNMYKYNTYILCKTVTVEIKFIQWLNKVTRKTRNNVLQSQITNWLT